MSRSARAPSPASSSSARSNRPTTSWWPSVVGFSQSRSTSAGQIRQHAALIDEVEETLGPIDILVNNAAAGAFRPFMDSTDETMATTLELNFWAPWQLIRPALPTKRERGRGWILNVSSQTATLPEGPPFPPTIRTEGTMTAGRRHS